MCKCRTPERMAETPDDDARCAYCDGILTAREGWRVTVDAHGMVTRGDPRPQTLSPFVARALASLLPEKELAR